MSKNSRIYEGRSCFFSVSISCDSTWRGKLSLWTASFCSFKKNTIAFLSNPLHLCHPWIYFIRLTFYYLYILLLMYYLPTTRASFLPIKLLLVIQISFQNLSGSKSFLILSSDPVPLPLPHHRQIITGSVCTCPWTSIAFELSPSCDN